MSIYAAITRLVHHYDYLPIEMVCYVVTGTIGADDVSHAYSDPSWTMRNKAYDTMSPEEVRAAARCARHTDQLQVCDDIFCIAFAIIASHGSTAFNRMHAGLQSAHDAAKKRKYEALQHDEPPQQEVVMEEEPPVENGASEEDDVLAFLGI
jgi:hypothetical protein